MPVGIEGAVWGDHWGAGGDCKSNWNCKEKWEGCFDMIEDLVLQLSHPK